MLDQKSAGIFGLQNINGGRISQLDDKRLVANLRMQIVFVSSQLTKIITTLSTGVRLPNYSDIATSNILSQIFILYLNIYLLFLCMFITAFDNPLSCVFSKCRRGEFECVQFSLHTPITGPCTVHVLWRKHQAGNIHLCKNKIN